ncbi:MAG: AAA family ATPase [Sulfurisoma sp.]|nr:AAA family ATPase [Sulfurisoma sp.]
MAAMSDALPPLIRTLLDPARSKLGAARIELVETHASWVLLAGEFAWKIKKPIVLPFLDYGTVDKRRAACSAELRLNRRLAPGLYLDVVDFDGEPAVKMRRFDEAARLDHVCKRGALTPAHLSGLASALARFHARIAVAPAPTFFGTPARVLDAALENFTELRELTRGSLDDELDSLDAWTRAEFARLETTFAARRAAGFIRECHGDLHLGNLVLLDNQVTPFDAIEFNDDFRWIDVASEIAFTLVDLLDHGQPGLACWLLNEWLVETGDFDALQVLRFYMTYRALVRAKVAAIRACQRNDAHPADCPEVRDYLALAGAIAVPAAPSQGIPLRITFCITHGVSGSGKTTASTRRLLADPRCATVRLRSDVERKRLFDLAALEPSRSPRDGGIYTPEANERTYARLAELAAAALDAGWSVIVDAAFLKRAERAAFRAIASARGLPFAIIECAASANELRQRVASRQGDASEATVAVLENQLVWDEPLAADEQAFAVSG